jgi:hypothetical protein
MSGHGARDIIKEISPAFARVGIFEKLLYSYTVIMDAVLDHANAGVAARFPTRTKTTTSLPYIGSDLNIPQGVVEASSSYAQRLKRAIDDWRRAGSNRSIISQVLGYLSPAAPRVQCVNNFSAWDTVPTGSDPTTVPTHTPAVYAVAPTQNWTWDDTAMAPYAQPMWWRWWLIIDAGTWAQAPTTYAGGRSWGDANPFSWGSLTPSTWFDSIRAIARLWKAKHGSLWWIIIARNGTDFVATDAPGAATLPDGGYRTWSKVVGNTRVPARTLSAMYVDGVR